MTIEQMKKTVSFLLALVFVLAMVPMKIAPKVAAETNIPNRSLTTLKREKSNIAPGVTQEIATVRKQYNGQQLVYYTMTVDLDNPYTNIHANYKDNDPEAARSNFGMQKVLNQMDAAQEKHKDDPNYQIVGGINGSGYNMSTGETRGILIMEGQVVHEDMVNASASPEPFFAIDKNKQAHIYWNENGDDWKNHKNELQDAINYFGSVLIRDGEIVCGTANSPNARTAIGVTDDNKVVMLVADGKLAPYSEGCDMYELALILKKAGCTNAINLDGGGSTTFVSRPEGEETYRVVNTPCDGAPRTVSASLFVVSTAPDDKKFNRASIDADTEYITPEGTINLTATGITAAGTPVSIPTTATWEVDSQFGTIENATTTSAVFTSNGTQGTFDIKMMNDGAEVGKVTVNVVIPTKFSFKLPGYAAPYGEVFDLTFNVTYSPEGKEEEEDHPVTTHEGDITVGIDNTAATVNGITLKTCSEAEKPATDATLTATLNCAQLQATPVKFTPGKGSQVIFDFEGNDDKNKQENFFTSIGTDSKFSITAEIVDKETGKVHGGSHSMKVTLDLSQEVTSAVGAGVFPQTWLRSHTLVDMTGATGVGFWIWVPDEDNWMGIMLSTTVGTGSSYIIKPNCEGVNYDEGHWYYVYRDLSAFTNQKLETREGLVSFMLYGQDKFEEPIMSANTKLTYYIDDYTVDYATVNDDRTMPVIGDVKSVGLEGTLTREKVYAFAGNTVSFHAAVYDAAEGRNNGINVNSAEAYIDGREIDVSCDGKEIRTSEVTLAPGEHTLKLYISDNSGNTNNATRRFTVSSGSAAAVKLEVSEKNLFTDKIPMDSILWVNMTATDIDKIQNVSMDLDLTNIDKWELKHIVVNPAFKATKAAIEGSYATDENIATFTFERLEGKTPSDFGSDVIASIPVRAWGGSVDQTTATNAWKLAQDGGGFFPVDVSIEVDRGEIVYVEDYNPDVLPVFGGKLQVNTECYHYSDTVVSDPENSEKTHWHFHDANATVVEDKTATCTEMGYSGWTICKTCGTPVTWGTITQPTGHEYVVVEATGERACSKCHGKFTGEFEGRLYENGKLVEGWRTDGTYYVDGKPLGAGLHKTQDTVDGKPVERWHLFDADGVCDKDNREDGYTGYYTEDKNGVRTPVPELPTDPKAVDSTKYFYIEGGLPYTGWLFFRNGSQYDPNQKPTDTPSDTPDTPDPAPGTSGETSEGTDSGVQDKDQQQMIMNTTGYHVHKDGRVYSVTNTDTRTCVVSGNIEYKCNGCGETKLSERLWWEGHQWDENHVCKREGCGFHGLNIAEASLNIMGKHFEFTGGGESGQIRAAVYVYHDGKQLSVRSDKNGHDGYVSYSNNSEIGIATVHILGVGDYYGELTGTFEIVPKSVTTVTMTETAAKDADHVTVNLTWDVPMGATFYDVWRYDYVQGDWIHAGQVNTNSFTETLEVGTDYDYRVAARAYGEDENGKTRVFNCVNWSESVNGTIRHSWGPEKEKVEANCTTEGHYTHVCTKCGFVETVTVPALGHKVEEWEITKDPTMYEEGERQGECTVCGETVTETLERLPYVNPGYNTDTNPDNKTETTTNPDGSTTTTTTKPDGSKTETTEKADGTVTEKNTDKDGVVTETTKTPDNTVTEKITQTDGSATERTTTPEGVTGQVSTDAKGEITAAEVVIPEAKTDEVVTAPVEVQAAKSADEAPEISVRVEKDSARVEIPVTDVTPGTVAVLVHEDGTEEIIRDCAVTEDGIVLGVEGEVTVKLVDATQTFKDVEDEGHWAKDEVEFVAARQLFNGEGNNNFNPDGDMTRGMLVTVLHRLAYEPDAVKTSFGDVNANEYYAEAVSWAAGMGVVNGTGNGSFAPEEDITREDLAVMLYRYAEKMGYRLAQDGKYTSFADAANVSDYARKAMDWALSMGLIGGKDGRLAPQDNATRAEVAAIFMRFCGNVIK